MMKELCFSKLLFDIFVKTIPILVVPSCLLNYWTSLNLMLHNLKAMHFVTRIVVKHDYSIHHNSIGAADDLVPWHQGICCPNVVNIMANILATGTTIVNPHRIFITPKKQNHCINSTLLWIVCQFVVLCFFTLFNLMCFLPLSSSVFIMIISVFLLVSYPECTF